MDKNSDYLAYLFGQTRRFLVLSNGHQHVDPDRSTKSFCHTPRAAQSSNKP